MRTRTQRPRQPLGSSSSPFARRTTSAGQAIQVDKASSAGTPAARVESIRRVGKVTWMMVGAGPVVLTSLIPPFRAERAAARAAIDRFRSMAVVGF